MATRTASCPYPLAHVVAALKPRSKAKGAKKLSKTTKAMKRPHQADQGASLAGKVLRKQGDACDAAAAARDTAPGAPHEQCHDDGGLLQWETLETGRGGGRISPALVAAARDAHAAVAAEQAQAPPPGGCPVKDPPPLHACGAISSALFATIARLDAAAQTRDAARHALRTLEAKARSAEAAERSAENTLRTATMAAAKHEARAADLRARTQGGRTMRPQAQQAALEKLAEEESLAAGEQARAARIREAWQTSGSVRCARQHALCAAREAEGQAAREFDAAAEPAEVIPLGVLQRAVEVGLLAPTALLA